MGKIINPGQLKKIVLRLQKQGKTIVFTNGCFDILHPGHIKVLEKSKQKGDILIVGLNADSSIRKIKGDKRPIFKQTARSQVLAALAIVDYVVIFYEDTPAKLIATIKPDYLVKGGDWNKNAIIGKDLVKKVFTISLKPGYSTSGIIQTILDRYAKKQKNFKSN